MSYVYLLKCINSDLIQKQKLSLLRILKPLLKNSNGATRHILISYQQYITATVMKFDITEEIKLINSIIFIRKSTNFYKHKIYLF